jgi:sec-independent protein translocase protein TatA
MFGVGTTELMIVFLIVLLLFGGAKLPQLARSLGTAISEFKTTVNRKEDDGSSDGGKSA